MILSLILREVLALVVVSLFMLLLAVVVVMENAMVVFEFVVVYLVLLVPVAGAFSSVECFLTVIAVLLVFTVWVTDKVLGTTPVPVALISTLAVARSSWGESRSTLDSPDLLATGLEWAESDPVLSYRPGVSGLDIVKVV